jgi:type I restriction enzyme M protein
MAKNTRLMIELKREDIEYFAKLVDKDDTSKNDYNIAASSYVLVEDTREVTDIKELNKNIAEIVKRQSERRSAIDEIVEEIEGK